MSANGAGFRERKLHATGTLAPVEGGVVTIGATKVIVPKGKGFMEGFARTLNEASLPMVAAARGDFVELRARVGGEAGNLSVEASWLQAPLSLSGGRTIFQVFTVEVDDTGAKVTDTASFITPTEAIASVKGEFVKIATRLNRPIAPAAQHPYLEVGGEKVCAQCGRAKDKH